LDAKITKQRLGNLLAYDWLKIVVCIAAAVALLSIFFTMVGTTPTEAQTFEVYAYTDVGAGSDFYNMSDAFEEKKIFSYEILESNFNSFSGNAYAGSAYTARRAAGEGTAMFVTDVTVVDDDGNVTSESTLKAMTARESDGACYGLYAGEEDTGGFWDTQYFIEVWCKEYLAKFYDTESYEKLEGFDARVEEHFLARNAKDKRHSQFVRQTAEISRRHHQIRFLIGRRILRNKEKISQILLCRLQLYDCDSRPRRSADKIICIIRISRSYACQKRAVSFFIPAWDALIGIIEHQRLVNILSGVLGSV